MSSFEANKEISAAPAPNHTPLPWRVFKNRDGTKLVGIGGQDGAGILDAGFGVWAWDDPEGIANAELVVRAVNSRAALITSLEEMLSVYWGDGDGELPEPACIQHARAALTAAKGTP